MEKRTFLAIVLSFLIILIWQLLFVPTPPKTRLKKIETKEKSVKLPQSEKISSELAKKELFAPPLKETTPAKEVVVTTSLYTAIFTTKGACLKSFKLHKYHNQIKKPALILFLRRIFNKEIKEIAHNSDEAFMELIPQGSGETLPLKVEFENEKLQMLPLLNYTVNADSLHLTQNCPQGELIFSANYPSGIKILKRFTFFENQYSIGFDVSILNSTNEEISGVASVEWIHPFDPVNQGESSGLFSKPQNLYSFVYHINNNVVKKLLKDIKENKTFSGEIQWAGFEDRYFISTLIPQEEKCSELKLFKPSRTEISAKMLYPQIHLQPENGVYLHYRLYLGPKDLNLLEAQKVGLEKTLNFGWFDILAKPLLVTLKFFYKYIHNYGVAIIILTILIKILFWPLTHTSFKSMKEMQKIQPEIAKLREQYKDKKEELNRKILELYRTHKVNPLGGCFPLLLQIPVFFALYRVLLDSIELRHANFISFWINDLSDKDPTYISPILMGISMYIQQKMTPPAGDPAQAKMMLFMPIIFTFMFLNFPSGLVLYWLVNNLLSIGQQLYINKHIT